jgi:hypothetical protein
MPWGGYHEAPLKEAEADKSAVSKGKMIDLADALLLKP